MLSRVIDNMEFSDFEDSVPYQYSHYLRLNMDMRWIMKKLQCQLQVQIILSNTLWPFT
jgi:biotin synthase-related radical SAM superfamily protein